MKYRWIMPGRSDPIVTGTLASELCIPRTVASLIAARGFLTPESASLFLDPRLASLRPPEEIPGITEARDRLIKALSSGERVTLYGDYDVDGVSSLTILCRYLRAAGGTINCFIPERATEGYGLSTPAVERCLRETSPSLVVAVDCGTNSRSEAEQLRKVGCDLVILDHHEPDGEPFNPPVSALVNPKTGSDFHYLCSAGVVFKLCHAMQKIKPVPGLDLRDYLDLVAVGTVADIVPLLGENRILVRAGLKQLEYSRWPGLQALLTVSGASSPYSPSDIGFKIGPRINAAGRLQKAITALELLLTDNPTEAGLIAGELDLRNRERQAVERDVTLQAEEWVNANFDPEHHATIVAGKRDWHQGVVGIVASRVARRWHRPTLIIGFDDSGAGRGSGRSIEGLPLVDALGHCSELLDTFGGHDMAAGLSLKESRLEALRDRFECAARKILSNEDLVPRLRIDAELDLDHADEDWLSTQERLAPFGTSNVQPLLCARGVAPVSAPRLLKEKHLRLELRGSGKRRSAIWFNASVDALPRAPWDVAYTVSRNTWQGRDEAQIQIVAIRSSEADAAS